MLLLNLLKQIQVDNWLIITIAFVASKAVYQIMKDIFKVLRTESDPEYLKEKRHYARDIEFRNAITGDPYYEDFEDYLETQLNLRKIKYIGDSEGDLLV